MGLHGRLPARPRRGRARRLPCTPARSCSPTCGCSGRRRRLPVQPRQQPVGPDRQASGRRRAGSTPSSRSSTPTSRCRSRPSAPCTARSTARDAAATGPFGDRSDRCSRPRRHAGERVPAAQAAPFVQLELELLSGRAPASPSTGPSTGSATWSGCRPLPLFPSDRPCRFEGDSLRQLDVEGAGSGPSEPLQSVTGRDATGARARTP
jgi:hypothetical protein